MFSMLDLSGNGYLEKSELLCGLSDLGFRDEMIDAIFMRMDENDDGSIDKTEFCKWYEQVLASSANFHSS